MVQCLILRPCAASAFIICHKKGPYLMMGVGGQPTAAQWDTNADSEQK